jgi:hypothetical protein
MFLANVLGHMRPRAVWSRGGSRPAGAPEPGPSSSRRSSGEGRQGVFVRVVFGACVSKRQIGERKVGRGGTVYEMIVGPRKAARADYENNLTIVKTRGGVAHFFHNGPHACHNNLVFLTLWRQTIVKMASGFFHNGPAGWRLDSNLRRKTGFVTGPAER